MVASSGARNLSYMHSRYKNIPYIKKYQRYPVVEINPQTAKSMEIEEGELVIVETLRGSIQLRTRFTEDLDQRVIFLPHGWEEANVNELTDIDSLDPITGFPSYRAFRARIIKKINRERDL